MTSAMAIELAQRRVNEFRQRCGDYGETALHLAYHAALPVALNAELLHLLRINFFLDPPEILPYTAEFEFLLSPLCREIDEGLYEIEPEIRDVLLAGLTQTYDVQRIRDLATLLWQYVEHHSPWSDRVELERAQQLTALNFLDSEKAQQWLESVEMKMSQDGAATREWFVAMRQQIENQAQFHQGEITLSDLLVALNDRNSNVRRKAAEALGNSDSEAAIPALINALYDENYTVRSSAAEALGNLRAEMALPALISALQDQNSDVRSKAVEALDKIKPEAVIPELIDALKDENYSVRSIAAEALGNIGSEVAVPALVNALQDKNSKVRLKAVEALDKIRAASAILALRQATNDPDADVRRVAAEVLARIDHHHADHHHANDDLLENVPNQNSVALLRSSSDSKVWVLQDGVFRIGRLESNDLIIQKPEVSRQHAEISRRYLSDDHAQPTYFIRDLSRYGTWLLMPETEEWQRIHQQEVALPSGTQLKFGDIRSSALEFSITPVDTLEQAESRSESSKPDGESHEVTLAERLAHEWRSRLQTDYPNQNPAFYDSILRWLLGDVERFDELTPEQLMTAQQAIDYRYNILKERYLGVQPERAYRRLIQRLSSVFLVRNQIQSWVEISRDRRRTVMDVLEEVIQELMQSDNYIQQQSNSISRYTNDPRLRNSLLLASLEEYCLRPIRNQPLLVYQFVDYLRRLQQGGMTEVPTSELIRLVSEEFSEESEEWVNLIDQVSEQQYQQYQQYHDEFEVEE